MFITPKASTSNSPVFFGRLRRNVVACSPGVNPSPPLGILLCPLLWPIQDIVLFMGFCARINTIICAPTLCLGTPPHPVIARTIAQYNVSPRPPVIAIYTAQYWQLQYRVKANPSCSVTFVPPHRVSFMLAGCLCFTVTGPAAYMLNTRNEENNTVFYSYLACFVNTFSLKIYVSMSYPGLTRRNTVFIFWWLSHRNTCISIVGLAVPAVLGGSFGEKQLVTVGSGSRSRGVVYYM